MKYAIDRRQFLRAGAAATFAATPGLAFSQGIGTGAPFPDYKALVCVFLFGGNDSFNMLVPRSGPEYDVYAQSRQNLALQQNELLPISPASSGGVEFGLHYAMQGVKDLFDTGRVALVANVGPLIEPTTKETYLNGSVELPPQLFSHNDQQAQWQSLKGKTQSKTGWAGRVADLIRTSVSGQQMATNASLFGASLLQSADETIAYVMGPRGPEQFQGFGDTPPFQQQQEAFQRVLEATYNSVYERAFAEAQQRATASAELVSDAIAQAPVRSTQFPASQLGEQLSTVAKLIDSRASLGMQRQIFFVATGGFDSHDNQNEDQPGLLGGVSEAMKAFYDATVEMGVADQVTSFTQSDFGRTLTSNGDGSDHAWGGVQLVVGDAVLGDLYGSYPLLQLGGPDDVGNSGRMIPTTSADQYSATLARWFGIDDADLGLVAPSIDNFQQRDLGFFV